MSEQSNPSHLPNRVIQDAMIATDALIARMPRHGVNTPTQFHQVQDLMKEAFLAGVAHSADPQAVLAVENAAKALGIPIPIGHK